MEKTYYNAAIYCRLSKDDDMHGGGTSISNQRAMIEKHCKENGYRVVDCYIDDGISGTTFERPGFLKMIEQIEQGKINMVIVKDLSRIGRDYLKTGYYTEVYFPENKVRFIAINDGIDSLNRENDIAPFRNILNEMYAKDISRKIKSAFKVKIARGDHQGAFAPYGYKKDPNKVGRLLIDEESAKTVRLIFSLSKQGYGSMRIRGELVKQKILIPSAYLNSINPKYFAKIYEKARENQYYAWSITSVERILYNEVYIGNMVHYKELQVSFKDKRRQVQPKENWQITENTHEAIIDRETWDLIQDRISNRTRCSKVKTNANIFARIVRCADCKTGMWLTAPQIDNKTKRRTERRYFQCSKNRQFGNNICTIHNASYKLIYKTVLNDIVKYANLAFNNEQIIFDLFADEKSKYIVNQLEKNKMSSLIFEDRLKEISVLLKKLFEENAFGRLENENYNEMFAAYQVEQNDIKKQLYNFKKQENIHDEIYNNSIKWIGMIKRYVDITELTQEIVNELIEKIEVYESEKVNGKRIQRIEIFYRFIGNYLSDYQR